MTLTRSVLVPALVVCTVAVAAPAAAAPAADPPWTPGTPLSQDRVLDLQAHRGGLGLTVEGTLPAFATALTLGVSTLELDVQITADGHAVVTHDRVVSPAKCLDTAPVVPGDPQFPYVGDYVKNLTLAQVRTLDCGTLTQPAHPGQRAVPGEPMPTLPEVLDLVEERRAWRVGLNIETKVEAGAPWETAPREQFVQRVVADLRASRVMRQATIQSFDWGALMRVREVEPRLPIVALTNGQPFLQVGRPGASPWLGGIDVDDFDGDLVAAAASFGADAISPVHGDPQNGTVDQPGYVPFTTADLVDRAHAAGIAVVPWTVNDRATMASLLDMGVDGIITDRPDVARELMAERGLRLPRAFPAP